MSVDVIESEDLEHKAKADNLFESLRSTPGVQIKGVGTGLASSQVFIRGHQPGILLNGRDSRHFSDNYMLNPNFIDMGIVERIEVLKGPQSTMHGGRSVSGAVNVIMKKGDPNAPFFSAKGVFGSGNALQGGLVAGGGEGRFSYLVSYQNAKQDKFKTPKGTIPQNFQKKQNFYTRLDYAPKENHSLSLEYTYNRAEHASGGEAQMHPKLPLRSKGIYGTDKPEILQSLYLSYEGKMRENLSLYASVGIGEHDANYIYGTPDYGNTILQSYLTKENYTTRTNDFLYGELRGTLLLDEERLKLLAGIQSRQSKLEWKITENYNQPYKTINETESYLSPYMQVEYRPLSQLLAIAGIRLDRFSYDKSNDKSAVSPRFSLSYFPFAGSDHDYTTIWGSYTQSFNPPQAHQLFGYEGFVDPNPDINPERTHGFEVGLKQGIFEWGNLEASYFDTKYKDKIAIRPSSTPSAMQFQNINRSEVKGYELKLELYPNPWLTLFASYTDFSKKDTQKNAPLYEGQANEILQYGVSVHDWYGFFASLIANRLSDYKNIPSYQKSLGKNHPSEGKTIVDSRFSYQARLQGGVMLEPFVAINNLTNETYYEGRAPALAEERNYQVGLNLKKLF